MADRADLRLRRLLAACDPAVLDRAVNYLYTKESRASFAIEGERPSARRAERSPRLSNERPTSARWTRRP